MTFSESQNKLLRAKLKRRHVRSRDANGETLSYIEGWHVIAEANRIFGFERWDRQTLAPHCHWTTQQSGQTVCFYSTKTRVTVRTGDSVTIREGLGTGLGRAPQPEVAHELAIKAAETDATKRALATFGNAFGLALYDPQQNNVTKPRRRSIDRDAADLVLTGLRKEAEKFSDPAAFTSALIRTIDDMQSIDDVYTLWARNAASIKVLAQRFEAKDLAERAVATFKARARHFAPRMPKTETSGSTALVKHQSGAFLIPKEKRIRDRAHLAYVASQPCLICGRQPTQAHHLRFAQRRAMSLKVSDEYTVPLCNTHHDQLHRTGDERTFWTSQNIPDPLSHARRLWDMSHQKRGTPNPVFDPDTEQEFNEPALKTPLSKN